MVGLLVLSLFPALAYGQVPPTSGSGFNPDPIPPTVGPGFNPPAPDPCAYGGCDYGPGPAAVDSPPLAIVSVPASVAPSSAFTVSVTGTDDVDVTEVQIYDASSVLLQATPCPGVQLSCTATLSVTAPSTFGAAYSYKGRSKDSIGQLSAFATGSGSTTAALVPSPLPSPAPVAAAKSPASTVSAVAKAVSIPLSVFQPLFLRSVSFAESECVRPGESAIMAVNIQNVGRDTLKDVKLTASVPELGVYASGGPWKITSKDKSTRFLNVDVPANAPSGDYTIRFTVSNNKFKRSVHRMFTVDESC